ncbi:Chromatin modification-related protein Eaf6 [Arabidopsis thaliana x Arabidopsis arenosa]|uniref:AT4G14385 protein n=2 Tax=Arabidopsis TaxID=3701 RepID=B9DG35_ARATH|nr:histone acetyltransferase subunit NuA4-domain protein [Arabidopsis thaliana]AEE83435.1 histone acetyltransferase subunit NuA4-domain protein [Arabidopsis thaliana]KAG7615945.1 Chromatin modification-related protein Eaf6 [Arabidopsis thaliana x Arabidopsis arenosa]BAH19702.1 AT4G14385 [Arabidopsis thaliana]|eukprot:NP_974546.1 histone acetyltransferase subunit NuA4-domain protein [Arabidopsis thaliana]
MSLGQKSSTDPGAMLTSLLNKREKLRQELRSIEKQVYELETSYLQESSHIGNALKGFEGFLSSSKSTASAKRSRKFQPEDRVFSLSSVTSPAAEELGVGREDGRAELGPGRSKGGLSTQLVSRPSLLYLGKAEERERTINNSKRGKEKQTIYRTRL